MNPEKFIRTVSEEHGLSAFVGLAKYAHTFADGTYEYESWQWEAGVEIDGERIRLNGHGYMQDDTCRRACNDALAELQAERKTISRKALREALKERTHAE